ncbi:MAG: hypothetical protein JWN38_964 [Candidatus Saccharibacteria bacterium]|nr:hypothetical protein [Candidatus Saccharibacteria bacterium]
MSDNQYPPMGSPIVNPLHMNSLKVRRSVLNNRRLLMALRSRHGRYEREEADVV